MSQQSQTRPKVGVGVLITSPKYPGCVLLGKRLGSAGSGTWATPGGHLEFGESWTDCATREVKEETGLDVHNVRPGTVINVVDPATNYHYVAVFMVAEARAGAEPYNAEPLKCEGWHWVNWAIDLPTPVFATLAKLRTLGFDPRADAGVLKPGSGSHGAEPPEPPAKKQKKVDPKADADAVVALATAGLTALCDSAGVDESHGVEHARAVLGHTERALAVGPVLPVPRTLAVRLAALLHDADDTKYFPMNARPYTNAERIMRQAGAMNPVIADALRMIMLVSCSKNGNSCPADARISPELLWPRWSDRLEATGAIGVVRCYQYNAKVGAPFSCATTPRPTTEAEAFRLATERRFAAYQASGGGSASMIDHYYDKLLQVSRPPPDLVRNSYLEAEGRTRAAPLLSVCLAFSERGEEGAIETIEALKAQVDSQ